MKLSLEHKSEGDDLDWNLESLLTPLAQKHNLLRKNWTQGKIESVAR